MMTKIATDFASKLAVAFVAVAMVVAAFAPAAQAQSSEDLQQMINDLLAQVAQLQGQTTPTTGGTMTCDSFLMDHGQGSEGAEVMRLQQFLNMDPDTRVAMAGSVGSAGMETMFYGPATAAAVSKFQVKYRAEILSPLGLVNPTGYWGAGSRAKANALCSETVVTTPDTDEDMEDMDEMDDEDMDEEDDFELGGSASLDTFEVDDASDDEIEEGDTDVEVGTFTIEFENGDAEISRMDIALLGDGETDTLGSPRVEPWEAFETVSLWVDGDMIAEVDASDEDDYLDEDTGELRFSNLNLVGMEDEEIEVVVAVTVMNNLDINAELGDWNLYALSMRFFDADGVATTEDRGDLQDDFSGTTADFEILAEGDGEELELARSNDDPDETTLMADDDEDYGIFAFELEADDSEGDIEIDTISIDVVISSSTGALDDVISDFYIEIDGDKFDAESYTGTGDTATLVFDVDGDFVVDAGDTATVMLYAEVDEMDDASDYQGVTITASLDTDQVIAEGVEDITVGGSDQDGESHPIRSTGIDVDYNESDSDTSVNGNTLTFEFVMDVTAFGEDSVLDKSYFDYTLDVGAVATGSITTSLDAVDPADEDPLGTFTLNDGESAEYVFTVRVTTAAANQAGVYEVILNDVDDVIVDESLEDVANFSS
jgi:hypothetical protein